MTLLELRDLAHADPGAAWFVAAEHPDCEDGMLLGPLEGPDCHRYRTRDFDIVVDGNLTGMCICEPRWNSDTERDAANARARDLMNQGGNRGG